MSDRITCTERISMGVHLTAEEMDAIKAVATLAPGNSRHRIMYEALVYGLEAMAEKPESFAKRLPSIGGGR